MRLGAFGQALGRFAAGRPLLPGANATCRFEADRCGYLGLVLVGGHPAVEPVEPDVASFTLSAGPHDLAAYLCGRTPLAPFVRAGQVSGDVVALSAVTGTFETALWHSIAAALDPAELVEFFHAS